MPSFQTQCIQNELYHPGFPLSLALIPPPKISREPILTAPLSVSPTVAGGFPSALFQARMKAGLHTAATANGLNPSPISPLSLPLLKRSQSKPIAQKTAPHPHPNVTLSDLGQGHNPIPFHQSLLSSSFFALTVFFSLACFLGFSHSLLALPLSFSTARCRRTGTLSGPPG